MSTAKRLVIHFSFAEFVVIYIYVFYYRRLRWRSGEKKGTAVRPCAEKSSSTLASFIMK